MNIRDKAFNMLRNLPRVNIYNVLPLKGSRKKSKRGRGQYGGFTHGFGTKGSGQRQNFLRIGYETGNNPFYLRFGYEPYYFKQHLRRSYPPLSLKKLQLLIDTNRIDITQPIDLSTICNTGVYFCDPIQKEYGVQLTDEGAECFKAKVNIEVQYAPENVIAAIERNGGVITTAYFDIPSLFAVVNPQKFFKKGVAIPRRMMPPEDAIEQYSSATNRGYLANPEEICSERTVLAQKYGYVLPKIEDDSNYEMLCARKDPRQIFYGLEPGWVVNLEDKCILKPLDPELKEFFSS